MRFLALSPVTAQERVEPQALPMRWSISAATAMPQTGCW